MLKVQFKRLGIHLLSILWIFILSSFVNVYALDINNKDIIGTSEKVVILPGEISFKAKIDTGADNSSMHATNIDFFSLSDKKFVRFVTENLSGESINLELPLLRVARIKRHKQESLKRAVVVLGICLGSVYKKVEVTLVDRSKFKKRFLIGASFLKENFIVDVSKAYTNAPSCNSIAS